ncbi:DUF2510 domain-containing protein [Rhodococcoides yunnanense]|uniref:DUF2510 domain-containing protein n=1 Tax=Rhodococcoides yunnanense TaxID=278209 RepID=A0ABU4B6K5_9NOCA|nr:DUF2510 domain-containing protein [Rhodococcus yunnanensis]MDV6259822.1 DUF2510 domain-containing protein [Rhodococcus yunnanensis]
MIAAAGFNGVVHFDGRYVTIERSGLMARLSVGVGEKRIALSSIQAIQFKKPTPFVLGYIEFTIPGGIEVNSHFTSASRRAGESENAVTLERKHVRAMLALRQAVDDALVAPTPPPPVTSHPRVPPPPLVPAGWYPDPDRNKTLRYWDGNAWTPHTAPSG